MENLSLVRITLIKAIVILVLALFAASCEDAPTANYVREVYVEGYMIVNEPVHGIKVAYTQPLDQAYDIDQAMIKDADVKIIGGDKVMSLVYSQSEKGYKFEDESYLVKPATDYKIEVRLKDGTFLWGRTLTPKTFSWTIQPKDTAYFPKDTINMTSADTVAWTPVEGNFLYLIKVDCLDTLDYGKYLTPATDEKNRRCKNIMSDNDVIYDNTSGWGIIGNTKSPCVWMAFKWFGRHEISVYTPDENMMSWFKNNFFTGSSYNVPNLNSINGGVGVFGSASVVRKNLFLVKNQK